MSISEHGINFLGILPAELRDAIWTLALTPLCERARHPFDNHERPRHHRFKIYSSLRLANRQISSEVEAVFKSHIAPNILFYCMNTLELYALQKNTQSHPYFRDARFHIRTPGLDPPCVAFLDEDDVEDLTSEAIEYFMKYQPGFEYNWCNAPGFYRRHYLRGCGVEHDAPCMSTPDDEQMAGFVIRTGLSREPCCEGGERCPQ